MRDNTPTGARVNLGERESSRRERISLGIAVAHATTQPGQRRTCEEIAAYCDCSKTAIQLIETRALMKMRIALTQFLKDY